MYKRLVSIIDSGTIQAPSNPSDRVKTSLRYIAVFNIFLNVALFFSYQLDTVDGFLSWPLVLAVMLLIGVAFGATFTRWGANNLPLLMYPILWGTGIHYAITAAFQVVDALAIGDLFVWLYQAVVAAAIAPIRPRRHFLYTATFLPLFWLCLLLRRLPEIPLFPLLFDTVAILIFGLLGAILAAVIQRYQQRLHASREQTEQTQREYRRVLENAVDGIYQATLDGQFVYVNQALVDMLGYDTPSDLMSPTYSISRDFYVHANQRKQMLEIFDANNGELEQALILVKHRNGHHLHLSVNARKVNDVASGETRIFGVARDVTKAETLRQELAQEQVALRQSEARNRTLVETIPDLLIWYSRDCVYLEVIMPDWYEPISDHNAETVIGRSVEEVLPAETAAYVRANINRAVETGETSVYQIGPTATGSYYEGRATLSADGRVLVASRDITAGVIADQLAQRRDAILSAIGFSALQLLRTQNWEEAIVAVLDRLGNATGMSLGYVFERQLNRDQQAVATIRCQWEAAGFKSSSKFPSILSRAKSIEDDVAAVWWAKLHADEVVAVTIDETLPPSKLRDAFLSRGIKAVLLLPIFVDESWWGFIGFESFTEARDWSQPEIDALRIAGANIGAAIQRQSIAQALLAAQKEESVGLLAAGIAHDFNNLLTGVIAQSSLAEAKLQGDGHALPHVLRARAAAQQAAALTRQLLAFSKGSKLEPEPIDVGSFLAHNFDLLDISLPPNVSFSLTPPKTQLTIFADPNQIHQLLLNLVINAGESYEKQIGGVSLTASNVMFESAYAKPTLYGRERLEAGPYVAIMVEDKGIGMSEELLRQIFDPYFSTKALGHGLGLAAVLGIVQSNGGALQVDSKVGQGSRFTVYLPAYTGSVAAIEDRPNADFSAAVHAAGQKVLVIDDEVVIADSVTDILELEGYEVLVAHNGPDGLEVYADCSDEIGLVLLDMRMPKMNGVEVLHSLKQIDPDAVVVMSSGYSEQSLYEQIDREDIAGFIHKPYDLFTLLDVVGETLKLVKSSA